MLTPSKNATSKRDMILILFVLIPEENLHQGLVPSGFISQFGISYVNMHFYHISGLIKYQ